MENETLENNLILLNNLREAGYDESEIESIMFPESESEE
jgi:hypothetical protein